MVSGKRPFHCSMLFFVLLFPAPRCIRAKPKNTPMELMIFWK